MRLQVKLQRTGLIALLALFLGFSIAATASDPSDFSDEAVRARLAPIGTVCIKGEECAAKANKAPVETAAVDNTPAEPAAAREPKDIYDSHCAMCHGTGAAGALSLATMINGHLILPKAKTPYTTAA